jgi:release factor glutamine methyltransferase
MRSKTTRSAGGWRSTRLPEAALASPTISTALARASARLAVAGCDTPRLDAEVLLGFALGVGRERLVLDAARTIDTGRFDELVARRAAREPVAYIVGRKEFRRIALSVDPRVLIPRPETELLVEVGLSLGAGSRVVDVGTGSGAVALALKQERPDLDVVGTDVSAGALVLARENARRLGLEVEFVPADLLEGVAGPIDAVLANLPYVAAGAELPPEISRYEPAGALFAGADGLDQVRGLVPMLSEVPFVALEVGFDQAAAVAELLSRAGFGEVQRIRDLAGHERVVTGRRS